MRRQTRVPFSVQEAANAIVERYIDRLVQAGFDPVKQEFEMEADKDTVTIMWNKK